ncbi:MAG: PfkB family carbohydrate kinase [Promethearchaeota archaeon]
MEKILVHGSIAIDYIMDFEGNLYDNCFYDPDHRGFHMMVMPTSKKMQYGGTGGNISYNLALLNTKVVLATSVGIDFETSGYKKHLLSINDSIIELKLEYYENDFCANCYIVNDEKKQQLIIYHGGATNKIPNKSLNERGISNKDIIWAINSPENPAQMLKVSRELNSMNIKTILDPGQVTPAFNGEELKEMLDNSEVLICNEHEFKMIREKIGEELPGLMERIKYLIVTRGEEGSRLHKKDSNDKIEEIDIPLVKAKRVLDPTGAGDGYRSGLLYVLAKGGDIEEACKAGSVVGSFVVETVGAQTQTFSISDFISRYEENFGNFKFK